MKARSDRKKTSVENLTADMRSQSLVEQNQADDGKNNAPLIKVSGREVAKWGRAPPPPREFVVEGMIPADLLKKQIKLSKV